MKITEELREYAKQQNLSVEEAAVEGMKEKREEFVEQGGKLYIKDEPALAGEDG